MSDVTDLKARAAAAGACALISDGDETAAQDLLRIYLTDTMHQVGPMVSMQRLVSASLGVAVAACGGDAEKFRSIASNLALESGEWV
jgi:hypothetical protein